MGNRVNNIVNPKNPIVDSENQPRLNDINKNMNKQDTTDEFKLGS
jgi:hypothetical protein